jgi:hypothetical protein
VVDAETGELRSERPAAVVIELVAVEADLAF